MHIADVNTGMLGANGISMLAVPIGQIAAVSTGYGSVTIAGQSQMSIASLARTLSDQNVKIGQTDVGTQLTNSFVNMAYAVLVGIGLVYLLLVSPVTFFAFLPVDIGGFVSLAMTKGVLVTVALLRKGELAVDVTYRRWIVEILQNHLLLVAIAARQRAKFEGWLKFELAQRAVMEGTELVGVESAYGSGRSDIALVHNGIRYDIELKTPNTSYTVPGVKNAAKATTDNFNLIIRDAQKLQACLGRGVVAFVLFPLPQRDNRWAADVANIGAKLETPLSKDHHCTRIAIHLGNEQWCDIVVCCFLYPSSAP